MEDGVYCNVLLGSALPSSFGKQNILVQGFVIGSLKAYNGPEWVFSFWLVMVLGGSSGWGGMLVLHELGDVGGWCTLAWGLFSAVIPVSLCGKQVYHRVGNFSSIKRGLDPMYLTSV